MMSMTPLKSVLFFLYCLAALTAIGTAASHAWKTRELMISESQQLAAIKPA
jgi:hypothetical protein